MINKRKATGYGMAGLLIAALVLSGCSNNANENKTSNEGPSSSNSASAGGDPSTTPDKLEPVTLTWHYMQPKAQSDLKTVEDEVNKITQAKINATIKLEPFDGGEYEDRMNTIVSAGDNFDIAFTANWIFDYSNNASKGAFVSLDELLDQYGPHLKTMMPDWMWSDTKVQDKIYGVPTYQIAAKSVGILLQKRFVDKYSLDLSTIRKFEDLEPFFAQLKANEPDIVPWGSRNFFSGKLYGYDDDTVAKVRVGDTTNTIVDYAFTPEYESYLQLARSWYEKGYIHPDIATMKNPEEELFNKGVVAAAFDPTSKPGVEVEERAKWGNNDLVSVRLTEPSFTGVTSGLNAISRTSKNPERALMFLDLVNSDSELYNLITYGIEGKHYAKTGDNAIRIDFDSGYAPDFPWVMGSVFNGYLLEGQPADTWDQTKKMNESAKVSPYFGFTFNEEPVQTEIASTDAVLDKYGIGLESGTLDPDKYLAEFRDKLKKAGSEKLLQEKQNQLNEWLKSH
ncbi:ABC transporter substrate-binding protein [Cohnella sp. GCM10027633]|uniref:ABC transporter substrate-binding protein n=1 Tax=unclassified Cohnella TaxID=2636738 RepID=UPI00362D0E13